MADNWLSPFRGSSLQRKRPHIDNALSLKTIEWVVKMDSRMMTATTGALSVDDLVRMRADLQPIAR